jgi:hypothetical protein
VDAARDGLALAGFAALPTYSRGAAVAQHLVVNGRPVRDKLLLGALRAGYMDVLARDRHPAARSSSPATRISWTSTSTPPRPRSASATPPPPAR